MKLISALVSSALAASWPGQSPTDTCGTQVSFADQSVNATCTLTLGYDARRVYLGGEWITGDLTFTNFDGLGSDNVDVVVFWSQSFGADGVTLDNSTCGTDADVALSCADNGAPTGGFLFQENANDYRMAKGSTYSALIHGNFEGAPSLAIDIPSHGGTGAWQNISSNGGVITTTGGSTDDSTDDGTFTIQIAEGYSGDTISISLTQQAGEVGEPNFWAASVV
jgi:hypothetical protein